jgi:hypothetical protein
MLRRAHSPAAISPSAITFLPCSSKRVTSSNERLMAACEIRSERVRGTRWKVCDGLCIDHHQPYQQHERPASKLRPLYPRERTFQIHHSTNSSSTALRADRGICEVRFCAESGRSPRQEARPKSATSGLMHCIPLNYRRSAVCPPFRMGVQYLSHNSD